MANQFYRPVGVTGPATTSAPALTIPQTPAYNTNPALTPGASWQGPAGLPSMIPGAAGQGYLGLQQGPGVGAGVSYPSQGGNSGNLVGGLAMDGLMGAAGAADLLMPGAGAAAKIGIQLANRTIGYAAQNVGIGVPGLIETLSLGDNPMGSIGNSWFGKIAGGLAGAAPALPNTAGQKAPANPSAGPGQQGGNVDNSQTNNLTVNNTGATENQNGKAMTEHLVAMQAQPGKQ